MNSPYGWWLPIDISTHGHRIDQLINVLHYFMLVLFIGWGLFMLYCLIKFRARPGHKATPVLHHFKLPTYLEVGVALFEVALLLFVSYPIWANVKNDMPKDEDSTLVRVTAEQFAWNFHYPGPDGKFGRTDASLIDPEANNPIGLDRANDPNAKDDIISVNLLHFPMSKPVKAFLMSKDVIHSFAIPVMRVKQDVVPGAVMPIWFQANQTGQYDIMCAQLCGVGHTTMRGRISVDTDEEFKAWMAEETAALGQGE